MKLIAPNYYNTFSCTAGECAHSCCIGWEIDIDENTYEYYKSAPKLGERLKNGISEEGGVPHFILGSDERCPFLNKENLCDIIISLGEDKLCGICADHPRFRNFYGDRTEIGLGLSCESAARLILNYKQKTELAVIDKDDTEENADSEEKDFFIVREKIFSIIQNREKPINERVSEMLEKFKINIPSKTPAEWADIYLEMERLDPLWTDELLKLKQTKHAGFDIFNSSEWDTAFEQLIVYFLYRHMADGIYDGTLKPRIAFAVHAYRIIRLLCGIRASECGDFSVDDMAELARMYSAEIEYSDENMENLYSLAGEITISFDLV